MMLGYNKDNLIKGVMMMENKPSISFKTLLTKEEYDRLVLKFNTGSFDYQTNYYFDTDRFSLKAKNASLRIRKRDDLEVILKVPNKYRTEIYNEKITEDHFKEILKKEIVDLENITRPLVAIIGDQKVHNFISLATKRLIVKYQNGILFIDENKYFDKVDFDLEYITKSNFYEGRTEFVNVINDCHISYQKTDKKIKRAFNALRATI